MQRVNETRLPVNPNSFRLGTCLQLTLLLDMKSNPIETWNSIEQLLHRWNKLAGFKAFECYDGNGTIKEPEMKTGLSPIQVVISGVDDMMIPTFAKHMLSKSNTPRCSTLDARLVNGKVSSNPSVLKAQSMVSAKWEPTYLDDVANIAKQVHAKSSRLRFWDTPDEPELWEILLREGVDLISTDRITGLKAFLLGRPY